MTRSRRSVYFYVRVGVLLTVLVIVAGYALHDYLGRSSRTEWSRPLEVAVVLLQLEPVPESSLRAFAARLPVLQERLHAEFQRYRPGSAPPFRFRLFGPAEVPEPPPEPSGDGFAALAKHSWALHRYVSSVDDALSLQAGAFDSRVYVAVRNPRKAGESMIEGFSQQGGHLGSVTVELSDEMVDLALFVTGHELLHTLGATDKYDQRGRALVPAGYAEPSRVPLYPQTHAEIMARNRPISATTEVIPETLAELAIGHETAREIGWLRE